MTPADRVRVAPVEGAAALFTPEFCDYLADLHDRFEARIGALLARRAEVLRRALEGRGPGPCSITTMFINALNPGPEGERAEGDLDDDEDSAGHRLIDTVKATHNRVAAVHRELRAVDPERGKEYRIAEGELPFFMHRERGMHLREPEVTVDGAP